MKCDGLEKWYAGQCSPSCVVYGANEVDAAIAELKAHIDDLEKLNHDLCERVTENDEIRLHWEEIEQTRAENYRLKAKLESVQATAYADSVDAGMRERRLQRALWLLKSRYFLILMAYASDLARIANPSIIQKTNILQNPTPRCMEEYQHEAELYDNVRIKCLKKADLYK